MDPQAHQKADPQAVDPTNASRKNAFVQLAKFGLAAAVVIYLARRGDIAWEPLRASLIEWQYSIPAFLLLAATPFGQLWRWQQLLRAGDVDLPNRDVLSCLMISKFFNMALPGYVSGDIVRGFYIFRRANAGSNEPDSDAQNSRTAPPTVVASILFDRAAGLLPLFVLCGAGLLGAWRYPLPRSLVSSASGIVAAGIGGMLFLFLLAYFLRQPPAILLNLARRFRSHQPLTSLHQIAHDYVRDTRLVAGILGISFLTQAACVASFVLFGLALRVQLPVLAYLILVPLGLMLIAVPITPAGLGVGQVAFLSLFHIVGTSQGANLFTLYMASFVLINLTGAFAYIASKMPAPLPRTANPEKL
jgi:uncharacterized membrane protein YbhN (UPF0104 family)